PLMSTETPSTWSPILSPEAADRALRVVEEIAADVRKSAEEQAAGSPAWLRRGPSLAGGDAGEAYFFTYLDQVRPGAGYDDVAMSLLERAIEATGNLQAPPGLYSGFSGVAWTLEHLRGRLFEDDGGEDPGEEVIAALIDHVSLSPWRGHYDLISGLVGFAVYALERLPRPGGLECLERIVARLAETAERRPDGVTWLTGTDLMIDRDLEAYPQGNYNLGVAHGVPGVIGVLAQACAAGVDARDLLDGAVAWLLRQKMPAGTGAIFPYNVAPGDAEPKPTRLAWCYGDLGIAASLLMAARAVGEKAWEREALEIARAAAARAEDAAGVIDAGVCHGAGGAAHLFNRLYQATGDPVLRDAALFWLERTLGYRKPGQGVGGYEMWTVGDNMELEWRSDPGFLTGSSGVGLVLLAAASSVEPKWDRVLLTDIPGRG
ncbi:MAG TPA: lanthionine synthetase C family protein, partial [Thermoanaerobaculia bacterium]